MRLVDRTWSISLPVKIKKEDSSEFESSGCFRMISSLVVPAPIRNQGLLFAISYFKFWTEVSIKLYSRLD